jgi:hypothetical protein
MLKKSGILLLFLLCLTNFVQAQQKDPAGEPAGTYGPSLVPSEKPTTDSILVTVILLHQQDKNLAEIRRKLESQGFWGLFPPPDVKVLSWTIAMGYGHIITLVVPANAVRRLNLALENGAWGAFDTDIYLTYDYKGVWENYLERRAEAAEDREDN